MCANTVQKQGDITFRNCHYLIKILLKCLFFVDRYATVAKLICSNTGILKMIFQQLKNFLSQWLTLSLHLYMPLWYQNPKDFLLDCSTGHRRSWIPFCMAVQSQKPKDVLLHGSTGNKSPRILIYMALRVPKPKGLPFRRLYSHRSPRTSFYVALQDTYGEYIPFIWVYRRHEPKNSHLNGS